VQTPWELKKKLLDEHHDLYRKFTTLILSLSTGAIGLLTTFRTNWIDSSDDCVTLANLALGLLLVSFISGLIVQHRNMLRPLLHTQRVDEKVSKATEKGDEGQLEIRREPDIKERIAYKVQIWSFYIAVVSVVSYVLININS